MKPFRSNTGLIAIVVTASQVENGSTTIWGDHIATWFDGQNNHQKVSQVQLFMPAEFAADVGIGLIVKVSARSFKAVGNNNSSITCTYYDVVDTVGMIDAQTIQSIGSPNLNVFTLGGNVGGVEQKNANGNTWYNISLALTRSFKVNEQWEDETTWTRLSMSQKTWDMNMKNGLDKGDSIIVEAELSTNMYTDNNGNEVIGHEYRVNRVLGVVHKFELQALKQSNQSAPQGQQPMQNQRPMQQGQQPMNQRPMQQGQQPMPMQNQRPMQQSQQPMQGQQGQPVNGSQPFRPQNGGGFNRPMGR